VLGVVHFVWRVKKDLTEPLLYAAVLALLFAIRGAEALRKRRARTAVAARSAASS
jgi:sulfoxide reductase heme-binding subunit YedZ